MEKVIYILLFIYSMYCQEEMLFYGQMKKYCKLHRGECTICDCWSCPRKIYKDEYKKGNNNKNG